MWNFLNRYYLTSSSKDIRFSPNRIIPDLVMRKMFAGGNRHIFSSLFLAKSLIIINCQIVLSASLCLIIKILKLIIKKIKLIIKSLNMETS